MDFDCKTQTLPAQPVLTVRTHTPVEGLPQALGMAYKRIFEHLQELGQQPAGAPFVAYYNLDMQDLDLEIGFPVAAALPGKGEVLSSEIPERKAATCLYLGPYPGMSAAYDALNGYVAQNGLTINGPIYEYYLNDPSNTPPQELQTEIIFPVN